MSAKHDSWAGASRLGTPMDAARLSWGGARPGSAGSEPRFQMPRSSITYDSKGGRMVYGLMDRYGQRIRQHHFENIKRLQNETDEQLSMQPAGRRHLQHQYQFAQEEKEQSAYNASLRPSKAPAYHAVWATSGGNPLNSGESGRPSSGVAELVTAHGTAARMYRPIDPLRHPVDARYQARTMYDVKREVENMEDEVRMSRMRDVREQFRGGFTDTRSELMDLAVQYPHGAPAHIRRQLAAQGVSVMGDTRQMSNLNNPFTRQGYLNY